MSAYPDLWAGLPAPVLATMKELGNFSPTVNAQSREVKGYMLDADGDAGKTYLTAIELRRMAEHFCIVADWLDRRAIAELVP